MKKILLLILGLLTIISGCSKKNKSITTISVSGAFALYPMMVKWSEVYQKEHPDVSFDINAGGAGKGMSDVLAGMVDIAMVSRDVTVEEEAKGAWYIAVAYDAVLPTMNSRNPVLSIILKKGMTRDQLMQIFVSGSITNWEQLSGQRESNAINVYTRADACGAGETWASYLGYKQEDLRGIGVSADPGVAEALRNDGLGIGYNNVNYAYDPETRLPVEGIVPIPLDLNGNGQIDKSEAIYQDLSSVTTAIAQGVYPSPPARDLYLVTFNSPGNDQVLKFLRWVLTEGQSITLENGYVPLSSKKQAAGLKKLPGEQE